MNKNVAIVVNSAWNVYNFRRSLIVELKKEGFKIIAIIPDDGYVSDVSRLVDKYIELKSIVRKGTNPFRDVKLIFELHSIYKKESIDLAFQFTIKPNIYGSLAASILPTKSVSTITGLGYSFLGGNFINKIVLRLYKLAFKYGDIIVFQNLDDKNLIQSLFAIDEKKIRIIRGSGIDSEYFKPNAVINSENPIIKYLFIGRLLYDKGISELRSAFKEASKENKSIELHIVGDIDPNNPASVNMNFDVLILPSYREGLPRSILEAMAMQIPVITTNVPGCKDTVKNNVSGLVVPVKNENELKNAIIKMSKMSVLKNGMPRCQRKVLIKMANLILPRM